MKIVHPYQPAGPLAGFLLWTWIMQGDDVKTYAWALFCRACGRDSWYTNTYPPYGSEVRSQDWYDAAGNNPRPGPASCCHCSAPIPLDRALLRESKPPEGAPEC